MMHVQTVLFTTLLSFTCASALQLTSEHKQELTARWQAIFQEEIDQLQRVHPTHSDGAKKAREEKVRNVVRYADMMVLISDYDVLIVEQYISRLMQGSLWDAFLVHQDVDAIVNYINYMSAVLQQLIWSDCELRFPPKLENIINEINRSGIQEHEFITKVRQVFLTFTIIVSHMDYLSRKQ